MYYCKLALYRWVLLILKFMPFSQYQTRNLNPPWSSSIISMASVISKKQCSGFFIDLSKSPCKHCNKKQSTIQINPEPIWTQNEFRSIKIYHCQNLASNEVPMLWKNGPLPRTDLENRSFRYQSLSSNNFCLLNMFFC